MPPDDPLLTKFDTCAVVPALKPALAVILRKIPDAESFTAKIGDAARTLIEAAGDEGRTRSTID